MSFPSPELIAIVVVGLVLVIQHGLYNKIGERIDVVDKCLGILDKRMDLADKRFDAMDGQLALLERGQAELRERMAKLEGSR